MTQTGHPLTIMVTKLQKTYILIALQTTDHRGQTDSTRDTTAVKTAEHAAHSFEESVVRVDTVEDFVFAIGTSTCCTKQLSNTVGRTG